MGLSHSSAGCRVRVTMSLRLLLTLAACVSQNMSSHGPALQRTAGGGGALGLRYSPRGCAEASSAAITPHDARAKQVRGGIRGAHSPLSTARKVQLTA